MNEPSTDTTKKPEEKTKWYDNFLILAGVIVFVWCATFAALYAVYHSGPCTPESEEHAVIDEKKRGNEPWVSAGEFGDMFGALSCLFSGLAFAGLIVTLRQQKRSLEQQERNLNLQKEDLKLQREEMEKARKEFEKQNALHKNDMYFAARKDFFERAYQIIERLSAEEKSICIPKSLYGVTYAPEAARTAFLHKLNENGPVVCKIILEYVEIALNVFLEKRDVGMLNTLIRDVPYYKMYTEGIMGSLPFILNEIKICAKREVENESENSEINRFLEDDDVRHLLEYIKVRLSPSTLVLLSLLCDENVPYLQDMVVGISRAIDALQRTPLMNKAFHYVIANADEDGNQESNINVLHAASKILTSE